jgi:hypothetical protein
MKQVMMWLLVDEILRNFAVYAPTAIFNVLGLVFHEPCKSVLMERDEDFMK